MKSLFALTVLASLASSSAFAGNIVIGNPSFNGDGCVPGSAAVTLSPDAGAISILFDSFQAQAGGTTGLPQARKYCIMNIPVQVSPGFQAAIIEMDYRGFHALPQRGYAQFTVDYALQGFQGPRFNRRFVGPLNQDFNTINRLRLQDVKWSACGANTVLSVNASMIVVTNERHEQTIGTVDSGDLASGIDAQLQYRPCQ